MTATFSDLVAILHQGGHYGYYWQLPTKASTWWNGDGAPKPPTAGNVYFGIHPTTAIPATDRSGNAQKPQAVRAQIPYIAAINCFFAEFDAKDFGGDKGAALAHVDTLEPAPSVVVDSGGGYHCYWLFNQPWTLESEAEREQAAALQARWVAFVGGDPASKDLARVLRVPGTLNRKYAPPAPVQFLDTTDLSRRYDRADLVALLPVEAPMLPAPAPSPRNDQAARTLATAVQKVVQAPDGDKHNTLLKMARLCGGIKALTDNEIETALYAAVSGRAADKKNALDTIRDGITYGRNNPIAEEVTPEPIYDGEGRACCPKCKKPLKRASNGNGWRCIHPGGELAFWWQGEGYREPKAKAGESTTETEKPKRQAVSERIARVLDGLGYTFRLNLANDIIECNGAPMDDITGARIRTQMRDLDVRPIGAVDDVIATLAHANAYHPVRDYLNALEWDGQQHISMLAAKLTSSDPPIIYRDGRQRALHHVYLFRWLIGACAKAMTGEQNMMLVLAGPTGLGKSELARWLCSGIPAHFIESAINPGERDTDVRLMTMFLWEVAELDATTRKADVAALKAFITKQTVTTRQAYHHHDTRKPALASFIGTVNPSVGFLSDDTGSRRFWITTITGLDWDYRELDVNQVWAEAMHHYRKGTPATLLPEEVTARNTQNKEHETESPLEGWITKHFDLNAPETALMNAADIIDHLRAHDIRLSGTERSQAMEISRVLTHLGVQRGEGRNRRSYCGIRARDNLGDNL